MTVLGFFYMEKLSIEKIKKQIKEFLEGEEEKLKNANSEGK